MKMLTIDIADSKFVRNNGVNIEQENNNHIVANGWDCKITPNGDIICYARQYYSDGLKALKYTIRRNGYAIIVYRTKSERTVLKKGFITPKNMPVAGKLYLSDGRIEKRQVYFKSQIPNNYKKQE